MTIAAVCTSETKKRPSKTVANAGLPNAALTNRRIEAMTIEGCSVAETMAAYRASDASRF